MNNNTNIRTLPYYNEETKTLFINRLFNNSLIIGNFKELTNIKTNVYITTINEEKSKIIENYLKRKSKFEESEIEEINKKLYPININYIIAYGNCNAYYNFYNKISSLLQFKKAKNYENTKTFFRKEEGITYRNYEKPYEYWYNNFLVDMCPDIRMCWNSILRKTGFKGLKGIENDETPHYIVVWFDTLKTYNEIKKIHNL